MWYNWVQPRIKLEEVRLNSVSVLFIFIRIQCTNLRGPCSIKHSLWGTEYPLPLGILASSSKFPTITEAAEFQLALYCSLRFICPEEELFLNSAWGSLLTAAEEEAWTGLHPSGNTALWVATATWLSLWVPFRSLAMIGSDVQEPPGWYAYFWKLSW